ncbi:unnamed protein product [Rotaria socialis]
MYCVGQLSISPSAQWSVNATTVVGSPIGTPGSASSLLISNGGIYIADNGTIYISDSVNNRIVIVSPNWATASAIIGSGPGNSLTQLNYPTDLFVTSFDIYLLDSYNYRVVEYNNNETNSSIVAGPTGVSGGTTDFNKFGISYQIFVVVSGNLYVSDQGNHRVLRFPSSSSNGTNASIVAGTSTTGDGSNVLYCPYGIFVDNALTLYIADMYNHRI